MCTLTTVVPAKMKRPQPATAGDEVALRTKVAVAVAEAARRHLETHHHFHGRAHLFEFTHDRGLLTVRGTVPSFYLKQVLQHTLRSIDGVARIKNEVDVVCTNGVSSVRAAYTGRLQPPK